MRNMVLVLVHLLVWWVPAILIILYAKNLEYFGNEDGSSLFPVIYGTSVNMLIFYGNAIYLLPRFLANQKILKFIVLLTLLFTVASALEMMLDFLLIAIYYPNKEYLFTDVVYGVFFSHLGLLVLSFIYRFSADWLHNQKLKRELMEQNHLAELTMLKAQVNPHFLFNTLNNFYSIAQQEGNVALGKSIMKLAGILRYSIYESDTAEVSIQKEIEFIENFIDLQKLRFIDEDPIRISFNIEGNLNNAYVPPLLFMPIVENAFKHGISLNQDSFVQINLKISQNQIHFMVKNSNAPQTLQRVEGASGLGLSNLKKRLDLLFENRAQLVAEEGEQEYCVQLIIPIK